MGGRLKMDEKRLANQSWDFGFEASPASRAAVLRSLGLPSLDLGSLEAALAADLITA